MGAVQEIHDRERELNRQLAGRLLAWMREHESAERIEGPIEVEWGHVRFRVRVREAVIAVTLAVEP